MDISPASIMRGAAEVTLGDVYSVLSKNGFQPFVIDGKLKAMYAMGGLAIVLTAVSLMALVSTIIINDATQLPTILFVLEGVGVASGLTIPLVVEAVRYYHLRKKLDGDQVSSILEDAREAVARERQLLAGSMEQWYPTAYQCRRERKLYELYYKINPDNFNYDTSIFNSDSHQDSPLSIFSDFNAQFQSALLYRIN